LVASVSTEVHSELKAVLKVFTFHLSKCHTVCFGWKSSVENLSSFSTEDRLYSRVPLVLCRH